MLSSLLDYDCLEWGKAPIVAPYGLLWGFVLRIFFLLGCPMVAKGFRAREILVARTFLWVFVPGITLLPCSRNGLNKSDFFISP